jgi:proline dehydrogenase
MRAALLAAAQSSAVRTRVERSRLSQRVVRRFVAGTDATDALAVTGQLLGTGRAVTLDHLGEGTTDRDATERTVAAYTALLGMLRELGVAARAETSLKLSALGQRFDEQLALDNARTICDAAERAGTTVTLDMEDHTTVSSTLRILRALREDFPSVGAVLQAYLHRTEQDCQELATPGSRVRLCKGAYREPASVAFQGRTAVADAYLRCLGILFEGGGYPMVASHDPRMVAAARSFGRPQGAYELQMLYGVRPREQQRLADAGETVRVYVPYGVDYFGYFMRRLAERPANLAFFLRAVVRRS